MGVERLEGFDPSFCVVFSVIDFRIVWGFDEETFLIACHFFLGNISYVVPVEVVGVENFGARDVPFVAKVIEEINSDISFFSDEIVI